MMPTSAVTGADMSSAPSMMPTSAVTGPDMSTGASAPTMTSGPSPGLLEQITSILAPITEKLDDLISRLDVLQTSADATTGVLESLSTTTTYGGGKTRRRRR
jgi:hypothetical protein